MVAAQGFARLWAGTTSSNLADGVLLAAGPLLVASLTRDPVLVAGTVVAQRLPWFLFTLVSGVLVDRLDRRRLLAVANLARAASLGLIAGAVALDTLSVALLYGCLFVVGMAETVVDNAALAVLPALVPPRDLERANGRLYGTQSVANDLVGPPLGSALFALSAAAAVGTGSVAFALAGLVLATLPLAHRPAGALSLRALPGEIREGVTWFWGHRLIRLVAVMAGISNLCSAATLGVFVLLADERLGVGSAGYGLLLTGAALGGILAGFSAARVFRRLGAGPVIVLSNAVPAAGHAGLALTSDPVVAGLLLACGAYGATVGNVVVITLRQTAIPEHLLGRVTSAYRMVALGALPVGGVLGGIVASTFGLRAPYVAAAAVMALMAIALAPVLTTRAIDNARSGSAA